jgi:hypothetical protein
MPPKKIKTAKLKKIKKAPSASEQQMEMFLGMGGMSVIDASEKIPLYGTGRSIGRIINGKMPKTKVIANRGMYDKFDNRVILR